MPIVNFGVREIDCKLVYWGPEGCGKATTLRYIHGQAEPGAAKAWTELGAGDECVRYFEYLPPWLPEHRGFKVRMHLYLAPGQARLAATRKLVLRGADGMCFVADSGAKRMADNLVSLHAMVADLTALGYALDELPLVMQYNRRDLPGVAPAAQLSAELNSVGRPAFETVATTGKGVMDALRALAGAVMARLERM